MRSHCLVLCLALLTASAGFAQTPADAPIAGSEDADEAFPPEVVDDEQPQADAEPPAAEPTASAPAGQVFPYQYRPEQKDPPDLVVPRIFAEAFGAVLGGVGMGIAGLLVGASALEDANCSDGDVCLATLALITVPAVFVGIPLGVQTAGQGLGGRGEFVPALVGTLVGTGIGLAYGLTSDGPGPLIGGLIVGPILGSIVGYEISNALAWRRESGASVAAASHPGPRVVPVVGATPRGGFLGGLSGNF